MWGLLCRLAHYSGMKRLYFLSWSFNFINVRLGARFFDNRSLNPHSTSCLSEVAIAVDAEEELLVEVDLVAEVEVLCYNRDKNFC